MLDDDSGQGIHSNAGTIMNLLASLTHDVIQIHKNKQYLEDNK